MQKRLAAIVLGMLTIPALGGVAYAASQSVSASPGPQVVIPAGAAQGSGDKTATHDQRDDNGVDATTNDVGDDNGVDSVTSAPVTTPDNPATHDVGDDRSSTTTSAGSTIATSRTGIVEQNNGNAGRESDG
jgi:hypothetical protein